MGFGSFVISFPPLGPDVVVTALCQGRLGHDLGGLVEGMDEAVDLEIAQPELLDEDDVGLSLFVFLFHSSGDLFGLGAGAPIGADLLTADGCDFEVVSFPVDLFPTHSAINNSIHMSTPFSARTLHL